MGYFYQWHIKIYLELLKAMREPSTVKKTYEKNNRLIAYENFINQSFKIGGHELST